MRLAFEIGPPLGRRATLGVIALRTDETLEHDFRTLIGGEGVALYTSRIQCRTDLSLETLSEMAAELPAAAALLPQTMEYACVAYACTSGATAIGPERAAGLVREGVRARHVTDPLTACIAACRALGVRRLGFVTPYAPQVSRAMRARLEAAGMEIAGFGSMEESSDERVARMETGSIRAAAEAVAEMAPCDAVFMACTNLRALPVIEACEARLGVPVLCSNQVLAWHMLRLAGLPTETLPFGRLMQTAIHAEAQG